MLHFIDLFWKKALSGTDAFFFLVHLRNYTITKMARWTSNNLVILFNEQVK